MAANYASQVYTTTLGGAALTIYPGATRDSVTDATTIATWAGDWSATAPVAGQGNVTGVLAGYLAVYPKGPQV